MAYVVLAAELFTAFWFVNYILLISGFVKEGEKAAFPRKDPLVRFFIANAKWAIVVGLTTVYAGTVVYVYGLAI
ncbi:hypothetical protein [uncultured Kiloniella sp.]|uniref:hypothetical protein n=1 Tax=uncultured Kiloniella sp. TaxID=1133091 RepID=UPI00262F317F|nr:hypothetical protein [uncultured Kiloniella sp.]